MKICIARHGETDWNISGILQGWTDVPLNDKGKQQAHQLAQTLSDSNFSRIYTSPLRRASDTAAIIAKTWNLPSPTRHDGLKERNFGIVQGKPKKELAATDPQLLHEILRRNPACHFAGGESLDHFATRVLDALTDIAAQNSETCVLAITHGWVMDVITRHINNLPRCAILDMKRKNGECLWIDMPPQCACTETDRY